MVRPTLGEKLRLLTTGPSSRILLPICLLLVYAVLAVMFGDTIASAVAPPYGFAAGTFVEQPLHAILIRVIYISALVAVVYALWLFWRQLGRIESYFDFRTRVMRELYLKGADPEQLTLADNIFRASLEHLPPGQARLEAAYQLSGRISTRLAAIEVEVPPAVRQ